MESFCKAEIAGVVSTIAFDRECKKLRLQIQVLPEGVDIETFETDLLSDYGAGVLLEVEIIDAAFDFVFGKVYDFDYIHLLADIINEPFARVPVKFLVRQAGQVIHHEPRAYWNKTDKGFDIYKSLKYAVIK